MAGSISSLLHCATFIGTGYLYTTGIEEFSQAAWLVRDWSVANVVTFRPSFSVYPWEIIQIIQSSNQLR